MRDTFRLFVIVGKAALIVTAGCFAIAWSSILLGIDTDLKPVRGEILGVLACFIPVGLATAWMLRKLPTPPRHTSTPLTWDRRCFAGEIRLRIRLLLLPTPC